jgi:hypothetical protein
MKRMQVLFGQRRLMVLVTLAALVLTAAVVIGSGASFTATSANPGNEFTAGRLYIENSREGTAILTAVNMKPGDTVTGTVTGTVTLENIGTVSGAFSVTKGQVADANGLGDVLQLSVAEGASSVYSGDLSGAMSGVSLGTWAPEAPHTYTFTVTWPNGTGVPSDNAFMGTTCTYRFDWNAVSL